MGKGLSRRIAHYLGALPDAEYGVTPALASAANYVLDSWFKKLDERNARSRAMERPIPGDLDAHIKEMWLGCEIHLCVSLSKGYPAYAKSLNAWAFSRLFTTFAGPDAPYEVVPFLDSYEYKEYIRTSRQFRTQSEQISISLDQAVTLPVHGTLFVRNRVSGCPLVVSFDFCFYGMGCDVTVLSNPRDQAAAEHFFQDLQHSIRANDIYYKQCLMFNKGHLDFFGIIPTTWDQIVLKDDIKGQIQDNSVGVLANMAALASVGMCPNRNMILISPPGMAKTTIFRATSNGVDGTATRIWCTGKSIQYPEHVTSLFEASRALAPCIVFIEDMDLFGGERTMLGRDSAVLNEFLAQLDGAQSNSGIVVMASTNDISSMDEALVNRPGRFSVKVEIPYPDAEDRGKMLHAFLRSLNARPDQTVTRDTIKTVIDLCAGFTGDYIRKLAESAVIRAAAGGRVADGCAHISSDDLISAGEQELRNFQIGQRARKHHLFTPEIGLMEKAASAPPSSPLMPAHGEDAT